MAGDLTVDLAGIELRNPLILASGVLGSKVSSLNRIAEHAGAVVTKSVSLKGRKGYDNPCVVNWRCGILNAVGLASPPAKEFAKELEGFNGKCPLIVSLFGSNLEEFEELVEIFHMADAFELNLSCPHAEKAGLEIGRDVKLVERIVKAVRRKTDLPVFAKFSIHMDLLYVAKACEEAGVSGITAINTVKGMLIDVESRTPILSHISGGVSGMAIKPIALKCVWDLYEVLGVPIIGCGGITDWRDVLEFVLAGAKAVQLGSALFFSIHVFESISESLRSYLRARGEDLADLIGVAHNPFKLKKHHDRTCASSAR